MARKSRKEAQIAQLTNIQPVEHPEPELSAPVRYKAGLYARLSMFNLGRSDSETIDNQIQYLRRFVAKQPDIEAVDLYVDNGHTGTNFDRPEFERMIDDIRTGKLNCLICRDLSRFGRSYLEAGFYIQTIFPFLGVRFIAINDEFDSLTSDPDSLAVSMKNIINAFYSRDISQKVSSTIDVKRKTGPFVFGSIPYGYLRDKEDPSRYVIDEEAAPIVHMIFSWAMDGASFSHIAKDLTALGVPTPQRHTWLRSGKKVRRKGADAWSSLTIQFIVTNRAYTGDFVCTKARLRKYDPSDNRRYGPEDWTVYPDNHPAYISKEDFDLLQDHILPTHYHQMGHKVPDANDAVSVPDATCPEPLRGILYCGLCGRRMVPIQTIRSDGSIYFRYRCKGEANEHRTGHPPFIMEAASLHFAVFWQVNLQIRYAMDTKELYRRFSAEGAALRLKAKRQAEINLLNGKSPPASRSAPVHLKIYPRDIWTQRPIRRCATNSPMSWKT